MAGGRGRSRSPIPLSLSPILRTLSQVPYPASPYVCQSYENTGGVGVFFPFWNESTHTKSDCLCKGKSNPKRTGAGQAPPLQRRELLRAAEESLLGDDAVGPLDQADKNRGIAEFCAPLRYICFRDPTGPAAGPSSKDGNVLGHDFFERFAERRPAYRHDGIGRHFAHQRGSFAEQENLHLMAGFGERESVMKRKRGLGGIIGAPGAFHHDLESFLFRFLGLRAQGKKG